MADEPPKQPRRPAEEENAIINSLRQKVLETYESKKIDREEVDRMKDYDFLRFIRARKYELEPAYTMVMAALEWKTKEKPHRTCKGPIRRTEFSCRFSTKALFRLAVLCARAQFFLIQSIFLFDL